MHRDLSRNELIDQCVDRPKEAKEHECRFAECVDLTGRQKPLRQILNLLEKPVSAYVYFPTEALNASHVGVGLTENADEKPVGAEEDSEEKMEEVETAMDVVTPPYQAVEVAVVIRSARGGSNHKGLARKVLPDVIGLFNCRLWILWSPNAQGNNCC
ncbi:hypothetical protein Nepgr_004098 [Nepenthes gracilis]|uniref:Uncharacterized protein n=1 Tax=Nepenthes gracilis TaxID=150966 RepID=A0AAD3S0V2_NEPGR|nr:hypothetical protein Nepgr_004098 [Nepenthes gracilis]